MAGRAGKGRTQRCLETAGQPGRQRRKVVVGMYQPPLSAPHPKRRRGWGSLQAGHSGTGERIPAVALGTKRTPALPSVGSTEAGWEMPPERSPFKSVPHVPSAHPQEVNASLPSLWLFSSFGLRKRVISYVIFNGTSACA